MRLLVVDNDAGFLKTWCDLLRGDGHEVVSVSSLEGVDTAALAAEAYDLALVDARMKDDNDPDDGSGLRFALELQALGIPAILVTAWPTGAGVPGDDDQLLVVPKSLSATVRLDVVRQFALGGRLPNYTAQGLDAVADDVVDSLRLGGAKALAELDEYVDLFRRVLPPNCSRFEHEAIPKGRSGAGVLRAGLRYADGLREELAMKFGARRALSREADAYDWYVGPLPDGAGAALRLRAFTDGLAVLAYSWVGDSVYSGIPFGPTDGEPWPDQEAQRRCAVIERLFLTSLNPWYRSYREDRCAPETDAPRLLDHYAGRRGAWYTEVDVAGDLGPRLCRRIEADGHHCLPNGTWDLGVFNPLPDPVKWVTEGSGAALRLEHLCPVHGDLHVGNLFLMPDDSPRLIDFGRTGMGHIYRDFAALETSIRLTCIGEADHTVLARAEKCAFGVTSLSQHLDYRCVPKEKQDVRQALRMTMLIRRAAVEASGRPDDKEALKEYLFAAIMHCLRYADGIADEIKEAERADREPARVWHALYAAAQAARQVQAL